jgi:mono/diheme cytochrome c family protein
MSLSRVRTFTLALVGFTLYGSLLGTVGFAGQAKTPPKSTGEKTAKSGAGNASLIADGKKVYEANRCANCHAISGKGGKAGPDLTRTGATPKHTAAWFEEEVKNPKAHKPDSKMPAYADKIKGHDLQALAAYLTSLKK